MAGRTYPKFSVFTVNNYNQYQSSDSQVTGKRQASGNNETKINKDKESNKDNNISGKPDGVCVSESPKKKKSSSGAGNAKNQIKMLPKKLVISSLRAFVFYLLIFFLYHKFQFIGFI